MSWAKMFAWFVGIPIGIAAAALLFTFGKTFKDLQGIAAHAKDSVQPILDQAAKQAEQAKATAAGALKTSEEARSGVDDAKRKINALDAITGQRTAEVRQLSANLDRSQAFVAALEKQVDAGSQRVAQLSQRVETANKERNAVLLSNIYPQFGERVVSTSQGWVDPSKKRTSDVYINIMIAAQKPGVNPNVDISKVANLMSALSNKEYTVSVGDFALYAKGQNSSTGVVNMTERDVCKSVAPPCIIYLVPSLKEKAEEVARLSSGVQTIAADRIKYSDPKTWPSEAPYQELLTKSGMDILMVLGTRP